MCCHFEIRKLYHQEAWDFQDSLNYSQLFGNDAHLVLEGDLGKHQLPFGNISLGRPYANHSAMQIKITGYTLRHKTQCSEKQCPGMVRSVNKYVIKMARGFRKPPSYLTSLETQFLLL